MTAILEQSINKLAITTYGQDTNPAIVFLHGAGVSSWMWNDQIEALQADYYCITIDLPGNGDSSACEWVSFRESGNHVAEVIRTYTLHSKAHLVGLSLGGYVALHTVAYHPDCVKSVIVSGVTTRAFGKQWLYRPLFSLMIPLTSMDWMINLNMKMMQLPDEVRPLYRRDGKRMSKQMLRLVYDELLNLELPDNLMTLPHRVLAVAGDAEAAMVKDNLGYFTQLPHGQAYLVKQAHHGWNGEFPTMFNDMIRAWLTDTNLPDVLYPPV